MRKSNFLKKTFSSKVGTSSPHFQARKKLVTYNIAALLTVLGSLAVFNCGFIIANAAEITSSVPEKLDELSVTTDAVLTELQAITVNLEILKELILQFSGYIFAALLMMIICILFIAIYKLFNKFFRF